MNNFRRRRGTVAASRIVFAVVILTMALVASLAVNAYFTFGGTRGFTMITQKSTSIVLTTSTLATTTYDTTITVTKNNSLASIEVANITTGKFPQFMELNPITNTLYVVSWNGSTYLAVINANTDKIVTTIANVTNAAPLVDAATNMVYVGRDIINGTTNQVEGRISHDLRFVAVDEMKNVLYAINTTNSGQNGTTSLFEINGTNNAILISKSYSDQMLGGVVLDTNTSTLFATDCTEIFACTPSYLLAINATNLSVESSLQLNEIFFAITFNAKSDLIYVTALQNNLIVINGTNDQLVTKVPVNAYANEFEGIAVDPALNEIFLSGAPYCSGFPECFSNTLYVLSASNYGVFATFVSNDTFRGPIALQFDPVNNETYMAFGFSSFVLAVKVPQYHATFLVP